MYQKIIYSAIIAVAALCLAFSCSDTVDNEPVKVASISLGDELWLPAGESATIVPVINPPNAANKRVNWESGDWTLAEVEGSGRVTAIAAGEVMITARARDGSGVSGSVKVIIPDFEMVALERITINEGDFSLVAGSGKSLTIDITPAANRQNVVWSSSNAPVAQVNQSGYVSAVSPGSAVITAASRTAPDASASVTVTVVAASGVMSAQEIFAALKGTKAATYGWADMADNGKGLFYANPPNLTLIDGPSTPAKRAAFTNAINNDTPQFIIVSGDIDLSDGKINDNDKSYFDQFSDTPPYARVNADIRFNVGSNTTIIGINNARIMFGGININNKSNIIIRNITFYDAHGSTANDTRKPEHADSKASIDALTVQGTSNGVWVDHCTFTDGTCSDMIRNYNHDGAFDIPRGKNITVSWCEFTNHDKVMLVAGSDALTEVLDRQITLHHNYFHGVTQRMPRTRGTQMHVYNNYYNDIGVEGNGGYCLGPGVNAHFIVENNYFGAMYSGDGKITAYYDSAAHRAIVYAAGNNKDINPTTTKTKPWTPAYGYALDAAASLPESVSTGAGATLVFSK